MSTPTGQTVSSVGNGRRPMPPPGTRSSDQIRRDVIQRRQDLSRSVDALRNRWVEATDVKRQIREHRTELTVGAAVVGLLIGVIALRRRR